MAKYLRASTVKCEISVTDVDGAIDPTTMPLVIYDPLGVANTTKAIGDLTRTALGVYYYNFAVPADAAYGDWRYEFVPANASEEGTVITTYFFVDETDTSLYCSVMDGYRKAGIGNSVIGEGDMADHIKEAGKEIDTLMGRSFKNSQSVTEWHDIEELDEDDRIKIIFLDKRPIQSITSMVSYDKTDTAVITWTSDDYWVDLDIGTIRLKTDEFAQQNHRVKVIYTYGYVTVPTNIRNLVGNIAAMRAITQQIGGTYDDVTSYSLPSGVSIGVGEPYTNMREALTRLEKANTEILKAIGVLKTSVLVI